MVGVCLPFEEMTNSFSMPYHLTFPPAVRVQLFPELCQHLNARSFNHSRRWVTVYHRSFNLCFPNAQWCWKSFNVFNYPLYIFFGEMSVKIFCPFFTVLFVFLWLSFESPLFILNIGPSLDMWFENVFSQHVAWVITILTMSLTEQNFLIFEVWFINFFFLPGILLLVLHIRNLYLTQGHKDFLLFFFPKGFIVLGFFLGLWSILS